MQISITDNIKEVQKGLTDIEKRVLPKAVTRSINDVAKRVLTQAKREVAEEMGVAQKHIKKSFTLRRASINHQVAQVIASGKPLPLSKFKNTRQLKAGVRSQAYGQTRLYKGAFIATMKTGHKGVFTKSGCNKSYRVRKAKSGLAVIAAGKNSGQQYAKALPIKEMYGPGAPKTMFDATVQRHIDQLIRINFPKFLRRNLNFYLSKI